MAEFGATGVLYSRDVGRVSERDVSALPPDSTQYSIPIFVPVSVLVSAPTLHFNFAP